ncbi:MAG TPA: twin-arginine translocation signal domain-containing protein [Puia sp.]|uniref:twin-arginine translocation signal domain-containing protein n=1 Tax=Puia sp. TaxID=2045100 RepID=UPI002C500011|nr:twin-arginine translocation signal domain-containing protein [Puia sp.]HVU95131.1 twin-arginine translocation signal domain-containing protein [Puia sp.]
MQRPPSELNAPRRQFLGKIAAGAAALTALNLPFTLSASPATNPASPSADPDAWFSQLKGKHRMVLDVPRPNELMPFAWPKVFLLTNAATGTPEKETNVVVVLRHEGIPYAFEDRIWSKYKFGEVFKINDPKTKAPSTRNPFWKPATGDFSIPGLGNVDIGINQLQDSGVMFCVCDMAITVYSAALAAGADPADVKKDWLSGLLPGVQPMPSGVWALGRAQEHGCNYIFAG